MSSIKQYIDFFNQYRESIDSNSAHVLNACRKDALKALENASMPVKGDENYEITNLDSLFSPDYGINVNQLDMKASPADAFKCDVPNMTTWLYFLLNDTFFTGKNSRINMPEDVLVMSLRKAAEEYPELVRKYYGKLAPINDPQIALNTLLAQDGLFVYIPEHTVLERPLQLVNILNSATPLMVNRRILIVIGKDAQAKMLVCDHTQNKSTGYLNSQVIEIFAEENSVFDLYDIEESSDTTHRVSSLFVRQKRSSNVLLNGITLLNGYTRNNINVELVEPGAHLDLLGMAVINDEEHVDNHTSIAHKAPHCHSNELFKYVLDGNSRGGFTGKIFVAEGASKTEAYQSNKNICASGNAKMYTKPQLEIYTDDVKCSHGATVGQLDQNALFYMRTRGISEREARLLLMQAFMGDVISGVRMEALKDRLRYLVERRFNGTLALCSDCSGSCHENMKQ